MATKKNSMVERIELLPPDLACDLVESIETYLVILELEATIRRK